MKDRIFLEAFEVRCRIGIYGWEQKIRQRVLIDLAYPTDARKAAQKDSIDDTLNYKKVAKFIQQFCESGQFQLVETLAEKLAAQLLKKFKLKEVRLRIAKPGAIRGSKTVGVEIIRKAR